jgi:hypothetical protein
MVSFGAEGCGLWWREVQSGFCCIGNVFSKLDVHMHLLVYSFCLRSLVLNIKLFNNLSKKGLLSLKSVRNTGLSSSISGILLGRNNLK